MAVWGFFPISSFFGEYCGRSLQTYRHFKSEPYWPVFNLRHNFFFLFLFLGNRTWATLFCGSHFNMNSHCWGCLNALRFITVTDWLNGPRAFEIVQISGTSTNDYNFSFHLSPENPASPSCWCMSHYTFFTSNIWFTNQLYC